MNYNNIIKSRTYDSASQECSGRGGVPDTPKTLAARTQGCAGCGLVPDRDVNAAGTSRNALRGREPAFGRKSGGLPRSLARKPSPSGDGVFTVPDFRSLFRAAGYLTVPRSLPIVTVLPR